MAYRVTLIPGDGTGPELTEATRRVLEATGVEFEWDVQEAGADVMEAHDGNPLPEETLASIRDTGVALKGPITTPIGTGFRSVNVALRHELNLYACLRPCKTYPGVRTRYEAVDVVIVRENTEDLYAGIEFESGSEAAQELIATLGRLQPKQLNPKSGLSIKPMSPEASERIIRFAFEYARAQGRSAVHGVTKANIMKHTDGLFLEVFRHVAAEYADIEPKENLVDAICMGLVQRPEEYDVLVLPNLYGDIVSDLAAGLVGGLGVAPGANIGADTAVFEATHGSAPKYRGQNKVNPIAMILSGKLMLDHLEEPGAAARLETAVAAVIAEGKSLTYDMKPTRDDPIRGRDERCGRRDHRQTRAPGRMRRKVTVIGAGNVGATCAQEVARRDYADVVLVDIIPNYPQGKALDMNQAAAVLSYEPNITGANSYEETKGSDVIVVTAGKPRAPGMSRDDLVTTNEAIVAAVTKDAVKHSPKATLVVVSNPLDAMCHVAKAVSKLPRERVVGMAGILDTARFRAFIAWETGASIKDVQTMVLGGHGDQMVPVVSATTVGGVPLTELASKARIAKLVQRTRVGGGEIVNLLGTSAWYAPGAAAAQMVDAILLDEKRILPCTALLEGEYGIDGLYMGVPVKLGAAGIEEIVKLRLSAEEKKAVRDSAAAVREVVSVLTHK